MDAETREFYAVNKVPVEKMIIVGTARRGLSAASIEAAAEQRYQEIKAGSPYRQIRLAWDVYSLAKKLKMVDDQVDRDEMKALKERLAILELPWRKRFWRRLKNAL